MPWALEMPLARGQHNPALKYDGYHEAYEMHIRALAEEGKMPTPIPLTTLRWQSSEKYHSNNGWLEPHEQPLGFTTDRRYRALHDIINTLNRMLAVSEKMKELVEEFEPGIHQSWPIHIRMLTQRYPTLPEEMYPHQYYGMVVHTHLNSIDVEASNPELFHDNKHFVEIKATANCEEVSLKRSVFGGHHIWQEEKILSGHRLFFSDEFRNEMVERSIRTLKLTRFGEV